MTKAYCIHCGKAIEDTDLFCGFCGEPTSQDSAESESEINQVLPPAEPFREPTSSEPARPRSKKMLIIISCIVIAALLIVGGVVLWQYLQHNNQQPALEPNPPATDLAQKSEPQTVSVPDLAGCTEAAAREVMENIGLAVGTVSEEYSATVGKGSVVSQTPGAGTVAETGLKVNLVISKGAQPTIVHTYEVVTEPLTWTEAKSYCESKGGYLACISSEDEYNTVLSTAQGLNQKVFWLGGYRDQTSGSFRWVDGSPMTYTAWASGEPNDDGGAEDYMALFDSYGAWGWYDTPNDLSPTYKADRRGFIMEREVEQPAA